MDTITVISERGFPHSAVHFEYGGGRYWQGFRPKISKAPTWSGYVDTSDRSALIEHFVKFEIPEQILHRVRQKIEHSYNNRHYNVGVGPDCVSLAIEAAHLCGLITPKPPNVHPYHLVINLQRLNLNRVIGYR